MADGPFLVQSIGLFKASLIQLSISQLSMIYSQSFNSSQLPGFSFESLEQEKRECFRQSRLLSQYLRMFRVGDSSLHVPYDTMYEQQKSEFFPEFFLDGCVDASPTDCSDFHGGVMLKGLYGAARVYQADVEATANV